MNYGIEVNSCYWNTKNGIMKVEKLTTFTSESSRHNTKIKNMHESLSSSS
jgi:hypothetical protein